MPGFTESVSRAWHSQRIAYVLPDDVELAAAPSVLRIEGLGDFKMRHTRQDLNGKDYLYADDHSRKPLALRPSGPDEHPAQVSKARSFGSMAQFLLVLGGAALTSAAIGLGWLAAPVAAGSLALTMVVGIFALLMGVAKAEEDLAKPPQTPPNLAAAQ